MAQVEGGAGINFCEVRDDKIVYGGLIPSDSPQRPHDIKLLANLLRSKIPIPDEVRHWLADLMDEDASSKFQFKKLEKRRRGPKSRRYSTLDIRDVDEFLSKYIAGGGVRKNAITDACAKFKVSPSKIEAAIAEWQEVLKARS